MNGQGTAGRRGTAVFRAFVCGAAAAAVLAPSQALAATTEYQLANASARPSGITVGPDGNLWFAETSANRIGRVTPAGDIKEFPVLPTSGAEPVDIVTGSDGNLWFTEHGGDKIGRITPAGSVTEFGSLAPAFNGPVGIAAGPDGNLWFAESDGNAIGRITTSGAVSEFPIPTPGAQARGIAVGPDGNLWFTESGTDKIGRADSGGGVTEFQLPAGKQAAEPTGIAAGPDGALWFTESGRDQIGRIDTGGGVTEYGPLLNPGMTPAGIASGSDGGLWFTEYDGNRLGRVTTGGIITELAGLPTPNSQPNRIAAGPDGNLWFTESDTGRIAKVTPDVPPVVAAADADQLTESTALLHGSVNPSRAATTYHFEYGIDTNYSNSTADQALDAGGDGVNVSAPLAGLVPGTLYHFRVVASNANGATDSADHTFTTQPPPPPPPPGPPPLALRPKPLGILVHVTPRLDRKPPFRFKASGYVLPAAGTSLDKACTGSVRVKAKLGRTTLASKLVHVDVDCGYAAHFRWRDLIRRVRRPRMALEFLVSFSGNAWLKPLAAEPGYARVG